MDCVTGPLNTFLFLLNNHESILAIYIVLLLRDLILPKIHRITKLCRGRKLSCRQEGPQGLHNVQI